MLLNANKNATSQFLLCLCFVKRYWLYWNVCNRKIHNRRIGEKGVRRLILNVYRYRLVMLFLWHMIPITWIPGFHVLHLIFWWLRRWKFPILRCEPVSWARTVSTEFMGNTPCLTHLSRLPELGIGLPRSWCISLKMLESEPGIATPSGTEKHIP